MPIPTGQTRTSAAPTPSTRQLPPATAVPKLAMRTPTTDDAGNSASAANAKSNASMSTDNSASNADHNTATTERKRKRSVSDPADADADAPTPKRTSLTSSSHISAPDSARATMDGLAGKIRMAPNGAVKYDLTIRDNDPKAWAQYAKDLYEETRSLRHVQDLGPYTMCIVAMMTEDGLWPKE